MLFSDLRPGDVLLFDTEPGVVIDDLIVLLTGSNVTHAALRHDVPGVLADAYPPIIALHALSDAPDGRAIHVRRLGDGTLPMNPVTDAAKVYVGAQEPYDMPGLVMLGLLLLYKHTRPLSSVTQEIVFALLKRVALRLDALFAKGKHPMVCSEFVFQCYADASAKDARYALRIEGGDLQAARTGLSLLERAASTPRTQSASESGALLAGNDALSLKSDEELATLLRDALERDARSEAEAAPLNQPLVETVHAIADLFHRNASAESTQGIADAVSFLRREAAFFVTPGDLLSHCPSLTDLGTLKVHREDAVWHAS